MRPTTTLCGSGSRKRTGTPNGGSACRPGSWHGGSNIDEWTAANGNGPCTGFSTTCRNTKSIIARNSTYTCGCSGSSRRRSRPLVMPGDWPFDDPENTAVFTTHYVLELGHPVVRVTHDQEDGAWQFHAPEGTTDAEMRIVGLREMAELDSSLLSLADLPLGWVATRTD